MSSMDNRYSLGSVGSTLRTIGVKNCLPMAGLRFAGLCLAFHSRNRLARSRIVVDLGHCWLDVRVRAVLREMQWNEVIPH